MQIEHMPMVRVFFEKTGRAKYISHLDLMRLMTRALRRTKLPCWYTQGFNPHLYLTFALPIALGTESLCESVEMRLTEHVPMDTVVERMNAALPPGIRVTHAAPPHMQPAQIAWADYDIHLSYAAPIPTGLLEQWRRFWEQPAIEVQKRTKKGEKILDIKPLTALLDAENTQNGLHLRLRTAAGITQNISPSLLLGAFTAWAGLQPERVRILREAILTETLEPFR